MRTRRDFLTPAIVIFGVVVVILALWVVICDAQTHTMPGSNVVPSGASLTISSGATITAAGGSTVTGFGGGGGTPGGSNTQVQYNNSSAFGGISGATTNGTTLSLKNLNMLPVTGTDNSTIDFGANYNFPALYLYNTGSSGNQSGWGLRAGEMQFFTITGAHYSWNKGGDFQASGTNEVMRLDNTTGTLNVVSGYKLGGAEFPIASNGLVKRTAANTYSAAASGTDYAPATSGSSILYGNGSGGFSNVTVGSGLTFTTGTLTSTGSVTAPLTLTLSDAATGAVSIVETLVHNSSNVGTGTSFGTGLAIQAEDSTTENVAIGSLRWFWTTPTHGSTVSAMTVNVNGPGTPDTAIARFSGAGGLSVGTSGAGFNAAAGIIDATSGFTINNGATTTGRVLMGNGTKYTDSTLIWPSANSAAGYTLRSDGANNIVSYPAQLINSAVTSQSPSTSDVYLAGSNITVTGGDFKVKGQYKCVFDMTKSAGTGAIVITLRIGTAGTTADAAIQTYTFGAGTSVADTGIFEVIANFRTVGTGTSAVVQGICRGTHQLATTGLFSNAGGWVVLGSPSPSAGFNSTATTTIGLSFNGSTAFAGTATLVQAQLQQ